MSTKVSVRDRKRFAEALKNARLGVPSSQYDVGLMYANGIGTEKSVEQAVHWLRQAAVKGLPAAQYLLGTRYALGVEIERDLVAAMGWLFKAAEQGHAKAKLALGRQMLQSYPSESVRYIADAAETGLPEAQWEYGRCHELGVGVDANEVKALQWYGFAAHANHPLAQYAMGRLLESGDGDVSRLAMAADWYRKAVRQSVPQAQLALQALDARLPTGARGRAARVPKSGDRRKSGGRWDAVEFHGDADARYFLGLMYQRGCGVEQSAERAQALFIAAALDGHPDAQWALAQLLESGDSAQAEQWLTKAAESGHLQAIQRIGERRISSSKDSSSKVFGLFDLCSAAKAGSGQALGALAAVLNQHSEILRLAVLREAASAGDMEAQYVWGNCCVEARSVPKDLAAAYAWWARAAAQGHLEAIASVAMALIRGEGVERDAREGLRLLEQAALGGSARAQWNLGALFAGAHGVVAIDMKRAFEWCQQSARQGFVPAHATLGTFYAAVGRSSDAQRHWRLAAHDGDIEAQFNLGNALLEAGKNDPVKQEEGMDWLIKAAAGGLPQAQSRVGLCYVRAEGVAVDLVEGHKWMTLAAAAGDLTAQKNLTKSSGLLSDMQLREAKRRCAHFGGKVM